MKKYTKPEIICKNFEAENIMTGSITSVDLVKQSMQDAGYNTLVNTYVTDLDNLF